MKLRCLALIVLLIINVAVPAAGSPNTARIVAGLKEALKIGSENSVRFTSRPDGFYQNPAIKITMPRKLKGLEKGLRQLGYDRPVDEFILSLNRAAEGAAPAAKEIFWSAIHEMTFEDAIKIWRGNDTAATEYFRVKTSPRLAAAFKPAVSQATTGAGVTRRYKELAGQAARLPLLKLEPVDIDQYVVDQTLNGLFYMLGEEERKIRRDPVARVTKILKEVFGY